MSGQLPAPPGFETMDDVLARLGGISPTRVALTPVPGTATVRDVVTLLDRFKRKFELIDGTLVEKIYGVPKSTGGVAASCEIANWNGRLGGVGMILGAGGAFEIRKKHVRIPDVSFTNWDCIPGRKVPSAAIARRAPNLAVEVLSYGNTSREMSRKRHDYFLAGVELVWFVDPRKRTVRVFTSPDDVTELTAADTLDGGDVLPGFSVPVARLFAELGGAPKPKPKKKK